MGDGKIDSLFRQGDFDGAAQRLRAGYEKQGVEGRDSLLYLLDLGLTLHTAGQYEESNRFFLLADQVAEIKDYTSLSTEAATFLVSDNIKQYKGEDFENVLISAYLAMNFALMGKKESALVEAKRVNRKLHLMVTEGKRKYKQNAFARYLSGILYESDRNWNDAYIDYKLAAELLPQYPPLGEDLYAMALRVGTRNEIEKLEQKYSFNSEAKQRAKQRTSRERPSEVVVIYQNGLSPRKIPDPGFPSVPKFVPRYNPVAGAEVRIRSLEGKTMGSPRKPATLMDIESVAIENLNEKWGAIVAKKAAGFVAKQAIGAVIDSKTDQSGLGAIVALALYAADEADVRSWALLPKELQLVRIPVDPGTYQIELQPLGAGIAPQSKTVSVAQGEKIFVNFRYMP